MIANILLKIGFPILINVVKNTLLKSNDEIAKSAGEQLDKIINLPTDEELLKSITKIEKHNSEKITQINKSIRTEILSQDKFVRRMRPTFGYIMAISWFIQMTIIAISVITSPKTAGEIIRSFAELSMMWSIGLSVLGVYVYKRSGEKNNIIK
ncbi:holin family protein [Alphaproteobacteria bacterium]|nr:holin family protein [Alphaproteobacteria bacterium]